MRSYAVAIKYAQESLNRIGLPDILPTLHAAGVGIRRSVLGGSHSVAVYPPIDSLGAVNPESVLTSIRFGKEVSLYVHIAFCETRCTFCHYAVRHYAGKGVNTAGDREVASYLASLVCELEHWGRVLAKTCTSVSSIYIGGGTPLILNEEALDEIVRVIRDNFEVSPGAVFCIEGSPLTITSPGGEDKLRLLKERGVNRLSFGVQSFDDAVLKYAARAYRREVPIRASQIANAVFENWNLDLIQGLYMGSPTEIWENLQVISDILPPHLTWYHGRFADRPQGEWYQMEDKRSYFENEDVTLLGRMMIWQELSTVGYHLNDGNRFVRATQYTDPFKVIRTSASDDLLGVGAASYSHARTRSGGAECVGYMFRNESDVGSYIDAMAKGRVPITTGRIIDEGELLALSYATGLRNGRVEDEDLHLIRDRKPELSRHYQQMEAKLCSIGILEHYTSIDGKTGLRMTQLGKLFEDEVLALFFSPEVKRILASKKLVSLDLSAFAAEGIV